MTNNEFERFMDELDDCDNDVEAWNARKNAENESFRGLELDPAKMEKLNGMKKLCKRLHKLDSYIEYKELPFDATNRHGAVQIAFPKVIVINDTEIASTISKLIAAADSFVVSAMGILEDNDNGKIVMTLHVHDMWSIYGKAPF